MNVQRKFVHQLFSGGQRIRVASSRSLYRMSNKDSAEPCEEPEQQESNDSCASEDVEDTKEENAETSEKVHSRKRRCVIDAPNKSNLDANGNPAEEF